MYHKIRDQELHPENYELKEVDPSTLEDECFDLLSRPRQTQRTIGLYLKKIKDAEGSAPAQVDECEKKRFSLGLASNDIEREVNLNKGFWVGRPEASAPITYKLKELFSVDIKQKTRREQGIFYRPKFMELEHTIKLAKAGLLYPEEEISDSEEEILPDDTQCLPLRKVKYKLCDPCKEKLDKPKKEEGKAPKDGAEGENLEGTKPLMKKIPTGCQCDYYGEHNKPPTVWDYPYLDEADMLRQHEMNKVLKPYKHELLNKYYAENPPVKFMAHEPGGKRTFPVYQISNL